MGWKALQNSCLFNIEFNHLGGVKILGKGCWKSCWGACSRPRHPCPCEGAAAPSRPPPPASSGMRCLCGISRGTSDVEECQSFRPIIAYYRLFKGLRHSTDVSGPPPGPVKILISGLPAAPGPSKSNSVPQNISRCKI